MAKFSPELTEALSYLTVNQPFFSSIIYDVLTVVETDNFGGTPIPTAATDGKHLIFNPNWFNSKTLDERIFVAAHEVCHFIFMHMPRQKLYLDRGFGPDLKPFGPKRWNKAGDYVINRWLSDIGLGKMPMEGLYHPDIDADQIIDDVYATLPEEDEDGGDGHGGHDTHLPAPDDAPTEAEAKRAVAAAAAGAKAMGKEPGGMERIVGDILEPKIPWQDQLRDSVTACMGKDDATWSRPNRRKIVLAPHPYFPGRQGHRSGTVVVQIDTSGSISGDELAAFRGETAAILDECNPEKVYLLWVDACVAGVDEPEDSTEIETLKPKGGGGTDMTAGIRWLDEQGIVPDTFVCLTDGYTPWPATPPSYSTIWVSTSDQKSPVGRTIHLEL